MNKKKIATWKNSRKSK